MDIIELKAIQLKAKIGVYAWEKLHPQTLIIDLAYAVPATSAADSDSLQQTIDYDQVIAHLKDFVSQQHFALIETLAARFITTFFERFPSHWVKISVNKPHANLAAKAIILTIERTRDE